MFGFPCGFVANYVNAHVWNVSSSCNVAWMSAINHDVVLRCRFILLWVFYEMYCTFHIWLVGSFVDSSYWLRYFKLIKLLPWANNAQTKRNHNCLHMFLSVTKKFTYCVSPKLPLLSSCPPNESWSVLMTSAYPKNVHALLD